MQAERREWTVMTWNVHGAHLDETAHITEAVAHESPDVVVLQEVRKQQAADLASALTMSQRWAFKHHPWIPFYMSWAEGAAILTPHALDTVGHTVVSSTTWKRSWRRRIVQWGTVTRSDRTSFRVYNVHLSPHELAAQRRREAARIADLVAEHDTSVPAIVAGDFNDQGDATIIYLLPGIEHVAVPPTNPAIDPVISIDHVLLPVAAENVAVTVPGGGPAWAAMSDHLPVTVRFTLDASDGPDGGDDQR